MIKDLDNSDVRLSNINFSMKCKCCGSLTDKVRTHGGDLDNMEGCGQYDGWWVYCLNNECINHSGYPVNRIHDIRVHFKWVFNQED